MAYNLNGLNVINGTPDAENLYGDALGDAIYGNGGADRLYGGIGTDILFGGASGGVTFAYAVDGTWGPGYQVVNSGDPLGAGPGTRFDLSGYGQSHDVFVGVGLNNTLEMANGHSALFLDDPVSPGVDPIRLVNIQKILLGSGGQIVDLTSTVLYGAVTILGNSGDDIIMSNAGADLLRGGAGADYLWGGSGIDQLFGDDGVDKLFGASGDDTLDGGAGSDAMTGGAGNDTYFVDDVADSVVESTGQGADRVNASITYTLGSNVENLVLIGLSSINGTGNALDNAITGNAGANRLDGGAGRDALAGGLGDDSYIVDNAGDVAIEAAGQGTDIVLASVTHALAANVENLTLTATGNINGTGNALDNVISGNAGNNTLTGGLGADTLDGGAGRDTMIGGSGNDTFVVDHASDAITELVNEGVDLVQSSITHTLAVNVENLTLAGTGAINGTGNALANVITGNGANNTLSGLDGDDKISGGNGNDLVMGGAGKDQLYGEYGNDTIDGGEGNDGLNGGADLDTLRGGNGDDGLFGGGGNDVLFGDSGNDIIYGDGGNDRISGGAGNDTLAGGQLKNGFSLGNDTFAWQRGDVVNTAGARQGFDHILDFASGDRLDFSGLALAGPAMTMVRVTDLAAGTTISADFGGSIGYVDLVMLDQVHNITLSGLLSDGSLFL